jgi:methionyl-tRNA formyltransferase
MKIVFITPLSIHHKFIISKIYKKFKDLIIVNDVKKIIPRFNIKYKNQNLQTIYERKIWPNRKLIFPKAIKIKDVNNQKNIEKIKKLNPDIIVTLGARRLSKKFLKQFKKISVVNLHGGNPDCYRGLDSHYWSIYHGDFKNIKVCIHYVNVGLDTGQIIEIRNIKLFKNMKFYQLRSKNAEIAEKILTNYLFKFKKNKKIFTKKNKLGRYYSFMPSSLKKIVEKKFINFTKKL